MPRERASAAPGPRLIVLVVEVAVAAGANAAARTRDRAAASARRASAAAAARPALAVAGRRVRGARGHAIGRRGAVRVGELGGRVAEAAIAGVGVGERRGRPLVARV